MKKTLLFILLLILPVSIFAEKTYPEGQQEIIGFVNALCSVDISIDALMPLDLMNEQIQNRENRDLSFNKIENIDSLPNLRLKLGLWTIDTNTPNYNVTISCDPLTHTDTDTKTNTNKVSKVDYALYFVLGDKAIVSQSNKEAVEITGKELATYTSEVTKQNIYLSLITKYKDLTAQISDSSGNKFDAYPNGFYTSTLKITVKTE